MYTILRLQYQESITYIMILVDNLCTNYDYLTYDFNKKIFVDESFTNDSFQTNDTHNIPEMIEKIDHLIKKHSLEKLMYTDINNFEDMTIEAIHVPENYQFKSDENIQL